MQGRRINPKIEANLEREVIFIGELLGNVDLQAHASVDLENALIRYSVVMAGARGELDTGNHSQPPRIRGDSYGKAIVKWCYTNA
jgi:hypothetical protein